MMAIYWVHPDGNDDNDGQSFETAKKTLAAIEKIVKPGDIVYVGRNEPDKLGPFLGGEFTASGGPIKESVNGRPD